METSFILLLILCPFIGALLNLCGAKRTIAFSGWIATGAVLIPFIVSLYLFSVVSTAQAPSFTATLFDWIELSNFSIGMDFSVDRLSALWLLFVTGIGTLIHLYSIGYMQEDEHKDRFFVYLNLFVGFMLMLVLGDNLAITFIGWEGVGLCSYLLIGFWYTNPSYNDAAKKAFVMNRIGDLGFLVGMFSLAYLFGTLDYNTIGQKLLDTSWISPQQWTILAVAGVGLFVGAMGKSAQMPLYTWLPDAMAGPTPVSALIHAATMVTAGIFLVTRMAPLYELLPQVKLFIAIVGTFTALFAAVIGLMQTDIKKVLAYSTVSQLGLMFLALGSGAYIAAVFHVVTHAFFKACLFLGAGSVIHGVGGNQDIRRMGGLHSLMGITYFTFLIATLAISGIPPFAGFFSKDEILLSAFGYNKVLWVMASLASIFTAFYMFRAFYLTFWGKFRGTEHERSHVHESPWTMTTPLIILAVFSAISGLLGVPTVSWIAHYLEPVLPAHLSQHHTLGTTEYLLMSVAVVGALLGIGVAYFLYLKKGDVPSSDEQKQGLGKVVYNKFYVDEAYHALFVKPIYAVSAFFSNVVETIVMGIVSVVVRLVSFCAQKARLMQTGDMGAYLVSFVVGLCAILLYLIFSVQ